MKTLESYIDIKNIDKSDWRVYKFEKIAKSIGERVEPTNTELEIYVGLEHLDSDSIHIKRYGKKDDVSGTKLRCYPGDVIFGRRRAYQRKAAIVEFDGFCSAHSLVLRANPDVIDPKLFPFFLHSDTFMHRAIDISVGSLSPTINWGTLKNEEFLLPPKDEQARLAELLWAEDEVVETRIGLREKLTTSYEILSEELIWSNTYVRESLVSFTGKDKLVDGDWIESKDQSDSGIRLLQLADIGIGEFINKSRRFINEETFERLRCFEVIPGDILIARMPDPIGRACVVEDIGVRMITAVDCCILRTDNDLTREFLVHLLNSKKFLAIANSFASGTTRQRISRTNLESVLVPKPLVEDQRRIVSKLNLLVRSKDVLNAEIEKIKQLQKSLINQIF